MFRLFKGSRTWHKTAHLNPAEWTNFEFAKNWSNLNKMFNLRQYYIEIAPPFSKYAYPRVAEMEKLDDDLGYYHAKRSVYRFIAWLIFCGFILDYDMFEFPIRSWRQDAQNMHDVGKTRQSHMLDNK
mmetsp:Transcript_25312/g.24935  ORF Transcript_25312/g.24935 Transcript_25312/m.24935 type:complete len:127 (-) Transcript_25312:27-407(-)